VPKLFLDVQRLFLKDGNMNLILSPRLTKYNHQNITKNSFLQVSQTTFCI